VTGAPGSARVARDMTGSSDDTRRHPRVINIAIYPDSNKIGLFGGGAPGAKGARFLEGLLKLQRVHDYDGEDTGEG